MNRRNFLAKSAALPLAVRATMLEPQATAPRAQDKAHPPKEAPASADSGKPNLDRYHLSLNRVLRGKNPEYTPEFLLEDLRGEPGRRFTNFSGDLSGRWIGALAASSSSFGEDFPSLDAFVKTALPLQHPEGYFGKSFNADHPADDDLALLWGNGRLLVGLMEYYSLRRDPAALAAARKLGDFLVAIGPQFNSQKMADDFGAGHFATSYICWTQQTEGLAALYAETKESKYRDLCADISARMQRRPGDHVHGYLCSVRGTLALYATTKDQIFLDRAVAAWNDISGSGDILITGGVPEAWSPKKKRTEGCAECDWLRLNLALYRATGEEKYLATAESLVFNEFAMNQFATGDYGHALLYEDFTPKQLRCAPGGAARSMGCAHFLTCMTAYFVNRAATSSTTLLSMAGGNRRARSSRQGRISPPNERFVSRCRTRPPASPSWCANPPGPMPSRSPVTERPSRASALQISTLATRLSPNTP